MNRPTGKLLRRLLFCAAAIIAVVGVLASIGLVQLRRTPDWYRFPRMSAAEWEAAAQRATNKFAMIQNEAARLRAAEIAARQAQPATAPATRQALPGEIVVSLTDQELNAFFDKWAAWNNWKAGYERYITDPVIVLEDGRLIVAARVKELKSIVSLHFEPRVDENGKLQLELQRVLGGNLPLPEAVLGDYRQRLVGSMQRRLPQWRASAAVDRNGSPNNSAVAATMGALLVQILDRRPGEPVLFLPLVDKGAVAVKLTHVEIADHALTLTVRPLSSDEREQMIERIKAQSPNTTESR